MRVVCATVFSLTFAVAAASQTFVVDAGNGPGTNFTSIAAAVAAVPDGPVTAPEERPAWEWQPPQR